MEKILQMNLDGAKLQALRENLRALGSVAVSFSGGVDSTFLLKVAHDELGDRCLAVTGKSDSLPERELEEAQEFCRAEGIRHIVFESREMEDERYLENPKNRCYYCKHSLFEDVLAIAAREGLAAVAEGSNMDDLGDYRPGLAAVDELHVHSPLREAGLYKDEIRYYSHELGLATWNKQAFACLSSRLLYGERITSDKLRMVERAEEVLHKLGFHQYRVRLHGDLARIEVGQDELPRFAKPMLRLVVREAFQEIGFRYVTVDLEGYRTGSMNEGLTEKAEA